MSSPSLDFDALFEAHCDFAWRVLRRHGVEERHIEDLCQEVFLVVHRNLCRFEGRSSPRTWIYGICRRVAANHRKLAATACEALITPPDALSPDTPSPDASDGDAFERLASKQDLALLEGLLEHLTVEQREVFWLYEVEELTMREVAEALDCSQNTAFSRLYAARRELEAALTRVRARRRVA